MSARSGVRLTRAQWDELKAAITASPDGIAPYEMLERFAGPRAVALVKSSYPGDLPWSGVRVEIVAEPDEAGVIE